MPNTVNEEIISELDKKLNNITAELGKPGVKAIDICVTYKQIRPALSKLIKFLDGLPSWITPGWIGTVIKAIKTLMALLDQMCS